MDSYFYAVMLDGNPFEWTVRARRRDAVHSYFGYVPNPNAMQALKRKGYRVGKVRITEVVPEPVGRKGAGQ